MKKRRIIFSQDVVLFREADPINEARDFDTSMDSIRGSWSGHHWGRVVRCVSDG